MPEIEFRGVFLDQDGKTQYGHVHIEKRSSDEATARMWVDAALELVRYWPNWTLITIEMRTQSRRWRK